MQSYTFIYNLFINALIFPFQVFKERDLAYFNLKYFRFCKLHIAKYLPLQSETKLHNDLFNKQ